jgi:uncharacterized damage-inducible protein DinB
LFVEQLYPEVPLHKLAVFLCLLGAGASAADLKSDLAKHWAKSKEFTLEVAKAMPDDGYAFRAEDKVQPPDRTFGEVMVHIGQSQFNACSAIAGTKPPAPPANAADKSAVMQYVSDSFDACAKALDGVDEEMSKMVKRGNAETPVREVMAATMVHTSHHRGQSEVYLRLKGVRPPAYRF